MKQYGIQSNSWVKVLKIFQTHESIEQVVLFGSRAKDNYQNSSDIDLCLFGDLSLQDIYQIYDQIDDLMLPYKFDLLVYSKITNPELKEHINRVGINIYTTSTPLASLPI